MEFQCQTLFKWATEFPQNWGTFTRSLLTMFEARRRFQISFIFTPTYLGKWSKLTNIFSDGRVLGRVYVFEKFPRKCCSQIGDLHAVCWWTTSVSGILAGFTSIDWRFVGIVKLIRSRMPEKLRFTMFFLLYRCVTTSVFCCRDVVTLWHLQQRLWAILFVFWTTIYRQALQVDQGGPGWQI